MNQSLLFRNFDSRPNTLKVFDNYRSRVGFQGFSGNLIGDIPEQPINATPLFSRQPFQEPSLVSALVPCGLKIAALFESALSTVLDFSSLETLALLAVATRTIPESTPIATSLGESGISLVTIRCRNHDSPLWETVAVGSISHPPSRYCLWYSERIKLTLTLP